jgi:hypothetical protein
MTDRLQNKVAIVFGAGSIGLGRGNGKDPSKNNLNTLSGFLTFRV